MQHDTLIQFAISYKYYFLVPAAFLEGHVITLISGFLARLGYLNPFLAGVAVAFGNLLGDIALYWIGYHKGERVAKSWGKYFGITDDSIQKVTSIFHNHKNRILLISKLTNGFGLAMAVLFTAGLTRIPFRTYMIWNVIGEIIWTSILVSLGFFLGHLYVLVDDIAWRIGVVGIFVASVFLLMRLLVYFGKRRL